MELDQQGLAFVHVNRNVFPFDTDCDYSRQPRPFYILASVLEGSVTFEEDGRRCQAGPGDTVLIPLHSCYRSRWTGRPKTEVLSCYFLLPESCAMLSDRRFLLQKIEGMPGLGGTLAYLMEHQNDPEKLFSLLSRFYGLCDELFARLQYTAAPTLSPRIQLAADYLRARYREPVSVEELARIAGMSVSHFYSCFRQEMGLPPIACKHRIAVMAAEQLLTANPDLSIEEVSGMTGFESSTYFRRIFKQHTGLSPRQYRKRQSVG